MLFRVIFAVSCVRGLGFAIPGILKAATMTVPAGLAVYEYFACHTFECCNDRWIVRNETLLRTVLKDQLYGQPFAAKILLNAVGNHWQDAQSRIPLVLMLHGPTGTGKNFITEMLAAAMMKRQYESRDSTFVHYYTSAYHFQDASRVKEHAKELQSWIVGNSSLCNEQLFVFDEAKRFPVGLLDSLSTFFDPGSPFADKVRRSIFIFLYEGEEPVVEWALDLYKNNIDRDSLSLKDAENVIMPYIMEEAGSMQSSLLVSKGLINFHLPFLPLQRKHVRNCISDAINRIGAYNNRQKLGYESEEQMVDEVEADLFFYPEDEPVFSLFGCKKVDSKVRGTFYIEQDDESE